MQTFLDEILHREKNLENSILIVPSRRAGSVLLKKLVESTSSTSFAPLIFSIEEFIEHITGLKSAHQIESILVLYESYVEVVTKEKQVPFSTFCGWAPSVLGDFNEIDRYLLNQSEVLNHLKDIKEINDHWSSSKSDIIINYIDFWNDLFPIYKNFCQKSIALGSVHQGFIYREAAENVEYYLRSTSKKKHVFIGFNALNSAEQQLIQSILQEGNAQIYWDTEKAFLKNKYHETNIFVKNYKKNWSYFKSNEFKWVFANYSSKKMISTYACSQNILQVKTIGTILSQADPSQLSKTAIILGDEALLLPLINSLPNSIEKVNVTMGFPLLKTPMASFFDKLFTLKKLSDTRGYYFKSVINILRDPLVKTISPSMAELLEQEIISQNKIYIKDTTLFKSIDLKGGEPFLRLLFSQWYDQVGSVLHNSLAIIDHIRRKLDEKPNALQLEFLYGFYVVFNKLDTLIDSQKNIEDINTLTYFYKEILLSETIDLRGDQEEGLQIMGVLESRVLDFENIILTSVNEGILPSGKSQNSNMPYDLKMLYKLPTYTEKDAIYAYHFYHLLHRAKKIDLLYVTHNDGLGSSEKSRFIRQIEEEGIHNITKHIVTPTITQTEGLDIEIIKTEPVINKLKAFFKKGASPSSLSTFLRDPILFYERYILGINDSDQVEETIAANTMGTIVHNTLEELYKPIVGSQLTLDNLKITRANIENEVNRQFKKVYGLEYLQEGKNKIIHAIVVRYINNYINREIDLITKGDIVKIISVEEDLRNISLNENVNLKGKVDLIELRNGQVNIIDYKTGKVEQKHLKLSSFEDLLLPEGAYDKAFQVLLYVYMLKKKNQLNFPVKAGIISFKNLKSGFLPFHYNKQSDITEETMMEFEHILKELTSQMLNAEIPFIRV